MAEHATTPGADPAGMAVAVAAPATEGLQARALIGFSTVTVAISTVAEVLGNVEKIEHSLVELVGASAVQALHIVLVVIVGAALIAGYAAGAYWLFLRLRRQSRLIALTVSALLGMGGVATGYAILPRSPNLKAFARKEAAEWRANLLTQQRPTGGIPVSALDAEAPTQIWTTAQVLKAALTADDVDVNSASKVRKAFEYIDSGKIATPPGGWGYFEDWQTGVTEIAGWVCVAQAASLRPAVLDRVWSSQQQQSVMASRLAQTAALVANTQQPDGGWGPTADRSSAGLSRTYSTTMALWCLLDTRRLPAAKVGDRFDAQIRNGLTWLISVYRAAPSSGEAPVGWVPNPSRKIQNEQFLGLDGQVLYVLSLAETQSAFQYIADIPAYGAAKLAFLDDKQFAERPLETNNRMHDGDRYVHRQTPAAAATCSCPFTVESSTFLWYPWSLAAARALSIETSLSQDLQEKARTIADRLEGRVSEARSLIGTGFYYQTSEFIIGQSINESLSSPHP